MAKILFTGGAGFIGSHVSRHLIEKGHYVIILDDLSGGFAENVDQRAEFVQGSITNCALIQDLFEKHQFDYVFHLAAYAAEGLSHFIKRFNYENNLMGSINLINESIKNNIKCFVFTSSIAVYGSQQNPMHEDLTPLPEDPYGIAKYAVEQELAASQKMFGLDHIIFRPHNVFGENQNIGDRYRNVIGIFMNQLMKGEELTIFGDGKQTRAFSYIDDIAPIIAESIENNSARNNVFNVGADREYTVLEIAKEVIKAMGMEGRIKHFEERNEVKHAYASHERVKEVFGEKTTTELSVGIQKMADWAKKYGPRTSEKFSNIEITENLPNAWLD